MRSPMKYVLLWATQEQAESITCSLQAKSSLTPVSIVMISIQRQEATFHGVWKPAWEQLDCAQQALFPLSFSLLKKSPATRLLLSSGKPTSLKMLRNMNEVYIFLHICPYVYMLHSIFMSIQPDSIEANVQPWWPKQPNHRGYWSPAQLPLALTGTYSPFSSHNADRTRPTCGPWSSSSRLPAQPASPEPWMKPLKFRFGWQPPRECPPQGLASLLLNSWKLRIFCLCCWKHLVGSKYG